MASSKSATEVDFSLLKQVFHRQNRPPKSIIPSLKLSLVSSKSAIEVDFSLLKQFLHRQIGHRSGFSTALISFASSKSATEVDYCIAITKFCIVKIGHRSRCVFIAKTRFPSSKSATEVDYSSLKQVLHHQNWRPKSILHRYNKFCIVKIGHRRRLFIAKTSFASSKSATEVDFASL